MSTPVNCNPCCSTETTTQIPGPQGEPGDNGADGQNAYTVIATSAVTIGAVGSSLTVTVASSAWMAIGQVVFLGDGTKQASMRVTAKPATNQFTGTFLGYPADSTSGTIAVGGVVTPYGEGFPMQVGSTTLVAGVKTVTGLTITANSVILVTTKTPAGTRSAFGGYLVASATGIGTGTITITAKDDTGSGGATLTSCTDVVSYLIIN